MIEGDNNNLESVGGSIRVRAVQIGFPVELTSTFDSLTGYDWKRLVKAGSSANVINQPILQQTGQFAVTPDGNQSLGPGDCGWIEPDPAAGGWFFIHTGDCSGVATTTTTASPCGGQCYWEFNFTSNQWEKVCDDCDMGCACTARSWCPPAFLELTFGACTYTPCGHFDTDQSPPNCTGTTTTGSPGLCSTTTTTPGPGCTEGC